MQIGCPDRLHETRTSTILIVANTARKVGSSAIIVLVRDVECKEYLQDSRILLFTLLVCPLCAGAVLLALNGGYSRWMVVDGAFERGWIHRKKCSACKTSFSFIPGFLVPWFQYPRYLIVAWLWACLWGTSVRNREFLSTHAVDCSTPSDDTAWTLWLECEPSQPSYSLLWSWTQRFSLLARQRVELLACTFSSIGLDLERDFAVRLEGLSRVPMRARWLALGLALWRALMEASRTDGRPVELEEALSSFVDFLLLSPSHGFTRAFSPPPYYTGSSPTGRPAP